MLKKSHHRHVYNPVLEVCTRMLQLHLHNGTAPSSVTPSQQPVAVPMFAAADNYTWTCILQQTIPKFKTHSLVGNVRLIFNLRGECSMMVLRAAVDDAHLQTHISYAYQPQGRPAHSCSTWISLRHQLALHLGPEACSYLQSAVLQCQLSATATVPCPCNFHC